MSRSSNLLQPTVEELTERPAVRLPRQYLNRFLALGFPSDGNNQRFPVRVMPASQSPYQFPRELRDSPFLVAHPVVPSGVPMKRIPFEKFLVRNGTTSLLVVRNGVIVYEKYFQGYQPHTPVGAFSVTKSFLSLLVGLALEDGILGSLDELVLDYLPELRPNGFMDVKIRHLMNMTIGLAYKHDGSLSAGGARAYYDPYRAAMLFRYARTHLAPDTQWLYNDFGAMLVSLILTRLLKQTISQYAAYRLFEPLGMPHSAEWILDRERGMEHSAGGLHATPLTFAMMGEMVRNGGKFGSKQVVPANWIAQSTTILPTDAEVTKDVISLDFRAEKMNYKCFWWIWGKDGLPNDFTGIGLHGQYIYISPRNHTVVVRTGKSWGRFGSTRWLDLMHDIAHSVSC